MATRTFTINADTAINISNNTNGNGQGLFAGKLGIGSQYVYRSFLKFNLDWSGVSTITSARLYLKSSDVWQGATPQQTIRRLTQSFSETTQTTTPSSTTTDQVFATLGGAFYTWYSVDITGIVKAWAPTSIPGGGGATNYGLALLDHDQTNISNSASFYDRESAYDPYIVLTYTSNTAPNAPTPISPIGGAVTSITPTIKFTATDPDSGDSVSELDLQVSTDSTFASVTHWNTSTTGLSDATPHTYSIFYAGTTLTRGTTYYWRARTKDAAGAVGAWTSAQSFKVDSLPTGSVTSPVSAGVAELYYVAGSSTTPKLRVRWSFSDADGHAQKSVDIKIYADSAGSPGSLLTTETYTGTGTSFDTAYAVSADTKYWVSITPTCVGAGELGGLAGNESTKLSTRVRYGRGAYYFDAGSAPSSISVTSSTTIGSNQTLVLEYATSANTTEPTTWYSSIGAAGLARYLWHRVTLIGYGSSPATSPKLNSLTWTYIAAVSTPDQWTLASVASVDQGTDWLGTQSLKHASAGAAKKTYQTVTILPDTDYILSGYVKTLGAPNAQIRIEDPATSAVLASVTANSNTDWTRLNTGVWHSGGYTSVNIVLYTDGSSSTAWFDALKMEASTVVTAWSPGFVANPVSMDAGGIVIDGTQGGVFRLRAADGTVRDLESIAKGSPTGMISAYGGTSAPSGWLLCDGSAVSRTTYAALFAVLSTNFGAGDGSTTFNVPDLRQRFPLGKAGSGTGSTLGGTGGSIDHTHTSAAHNHALSDNGWARISYAIGTSANWLMRRLASVDSFTATAKATLTTSSDSSTGNANGIGLSGTADSTTPGATGTNNPPFQAVNYIIKT